MLFTSRPIVIGRVVAILLKKKNRRSRFFHVLFYLPVVTNRVVVSLLFKYLFADNA